MSERADESRESAESVEETAGAGGEADSAEPSGDQDPGAERERVEQAERLSDDRPPVPSGPDEAPGADGASEGEIAADEVEGAAGAATVAGAEGEAAGEDAEPAAEGDAPKRDEDPLARAEAQRDEYLSVAQRTQADFDNYRKRAAKEIAAAGARGKAALAREMLPVVDNLERALASADDGEATLAEGVRLVHAELVDVLARNGVEAIEPAGERFDPNVHEALTTRAENGTEAGVVLDVVQKGYRLEATVLRPARVVVAA